MELKGLEWSMKPLLVCLKICGMPAPEPNTNRCRFFLYIFKMITLISLLFNFSFNILYFLKNWSYYYRCEWAKSPPYQKGRIIVNINAPRQIIQFFETVLNPSSLFGIPLIFVFKFYFTSGWRNIWSSIKIIDQDMVLTKKFHRRCRRGFILLIIASLLVKIMIILKN